MFHVASSTKSVHWSHPKHSLRIRRDAEPKGYVHAYRDDATQTLCGIPLSFLTTWPRMDWDGHQEGTDCPTCAAARQRRAQVSVPRPREAWTLAHSA